MGSGPAVEQGQLTGREAVPLDTTDGQDECWQTTAWMSVAATGALKINEGRQEVRALTPDSNDSAMTPLSGYGFDLGVCHACAAETGARGRARRQPWVENSNFLVVEDAREGPISPRLEDPNVEGDAIVINEANEASPGTPGLGWSKAAVGQVRFLQHYFRRSLRVCGHCWQAGGLSGVTVLRPVRHPACRHGQALAPPHLWVDQRSRWLRCLSWYKQYTLLLKRFQSGLTPMVLDLFCKAGGGHRPEQSRPVLP